MKRVQGNSKTLRVGIWNFKSHSHFLKVGVAFVSQISYIGSPRFISTLCLFSIPFLWWLSSESMGKKAFILFVEAITLSENGNLLLLSRINFVLVFTQRGVTLKEWISAVLWQNLIKQVANIQLSVFNVFHMTFIHGEPHRIFKRLSFNSPKTLQKINKISIGSKKPPHTSFFASEKTASFGGRLTFLPH